jgi:amino acid permease
VQAVYEWITGLSGFWLLVIWIPLAILVLTYIYQSARQADEADKFLEEAYRRYRERK